MAFEEYGGKSPKHHNPNYVSLALREGRDGLQLLIAFGAAVVETCKWELGSNMGLFFGTGEDKGKLLIKSVEKGLKLTNYGDKNAKDDKRSLKIAKAIKPVKPIEDFCNKPMESVHVKYEWDDVQEGLLIELPEGFFAA